MTAGSGEAASHLSFGWVQFKVRVVVAGILEENGKDDISAEHLVMGPVEDGGINHMMRVP